MDHWAPGARAVDGLGFNPSPEVPVVVVGRRKIVLVESEEDG